MDSITSSLAIKSQLSAQQLALLESEMNKRRKSVGLAYVLLIFLGGLGVHRYYLGFPTLATVQLLCFILGVLTAVFGIGFLLLFVTGVIAFIDLFLTPGLTDNANARIENEILAQIPAPTLA